MKRASEIIHIVPEEKREKYLEKYLNPSDEVAAVLWQGGIRKQFYYEFGGDILRTYEYSGKNFNRDEYYCIKSGNSRFLYEAEKKGCV